ncbi:hypothetical protein BH09GEM1_BH09GEM1_00990 [soil metagenome]
MFSERVKSTDDYMNRAHRLAGSSDGNPGACVSIVAVDAGAVDVEQDDREARVGRVEELR